MIPESHASARAGRLLRCAVLSRASDAAIVLDAATGRVLDANEAALSLYGYSLAELLSMTVMDLSAEPRKTRQALRLLRCGLLTRVPLRYHRRKGGEAFPAELTGGRFQGDGRDLVVLFVRDVSSRLEPHLLEERERMRRELLAAASHELRTPIAAILGFAETLARGGILDRRSRLGFVRGIRRNAVWLKDLLDDLLDASALDLGKLRPEPQRVDLLHAARRSAALLRHRARLKRVEIRVQRGRGLQVRADPRQLDRVFLNLLDNGVKYNVPGGRVEVAARPYGRMAQASVTDTGLGIAPEDLPHVFESFHRGSIARARNIPGTGLGLPLVRGLVEANGGRVWAASVPGRGTVFQFTLPLVAAT